MPGRLEVTRELLPCSAVIQTPNEATSLDRVLIIPRAEFRGDDRSVIKISETAVTCPGTTDRNIFPHLEIWNNQEVVCVCNDSD